MAIDAYNWNIIDNQDDEDVEPPLDEEVYDRMYGMMRTGASRSRSLERTTKQK